MDTELQQLRRNAAASGDYTKYTVALRRAGYDLIKQVRYTLEFSYDPYKILTTNWQPLKHHVKFDNWWFTDRRNVKSNVPSTPHPNIWGSYISHIVVEEFLPKEGSELAVKSTPEGQTTPPELVCKILFMEERYIKVKSEHRCKRDS